MDIKDLDKKQLILITLLITFVVSIATGIVTVSLMNQMPKNVPQTINNVIQRTIEKVTTVETPSKEVIKDNETVGGSIILGNDENVVSIYPVDESTVVVSSDTTNLTPNDTNVPDISIKKELGQGVIISDVGLILVDSSILNDSLVYKVILNKTDFDATVLKKFTNGFTILKISEKNPEIEKPEEIKTPDTNTITN